METGNWIAIAVGFVSLAGIAVTWWLGKKRFPSLREISSQVHGLLALLRNRPEAFYERPRGKTLFEELSEAGTILDRQADRLRFRFEGGPVAETLEETMDTTGKFFGFSTIDRHFDEFRKAAFEIVGIKVDVRQVSREPEHRS